MSFLSPVPGEKICADITGGYASLTPGYYRATRSGLIKWSRAYTALHWIDKKSPVLFHIGDSSFLMSYGIISPL